MIVEEENITHTRLPDGTLPVIISSYSEDLIPAEAQALYDYVASNPFLTPDQIATALVHQRALRNYRVVLQISDRDDLLQQLAHVAQGHSSGHTFHRQKPEKIAFVFPGQGGQKPGMGEFFYQTFPAYKTAVTECNDHFQQLFSFSPLDYLLDHDADQQSNLSNRSSIVQPAIFMHMLGLARLWQSYGVFPDLTIGHSQGEIVASYISNAVTLADAIRIVTLRAQLVDEYVDDDDKYAMAILGTDRDHIEELLGKVNNWCEVSVVNSRHIVAVSGETEAINEMIDKVSALNYFARKIKVPYPAHTSYVGKYYEVLHDAFTDIFDNDKFLPTEIPVVSSAVHGWIDTSYEHRNYWHLNLRNPVRFDKAIAFAIAEGATTFIEMSDHPMLAMSMLETVSELSNVPRVVGTCRRDDNRLADFSRNIASVLVEQPAEQEIAHSRLLLDFPNSITKPMHLWADVGEDSYQNEDPVSSRTSVISQRSAQEDDSEELDFDQFTVPGFPHWTDSSTDSSGATSSGATSSGATSSGATSSGATSSSSSAQTNINQANPSLEGDTRLADTSPGTSDVQHDVSGFIRRELAKVMGYEGNESSLDGSMPLVALGFDSVQALELRNRLQAGINRELPLTDILSGASLDEVIEIVTRK